LSNNALTTAIETLRAARTIAVVGLSSHAGKPAHDIPLELSHKGYQVMGVNPFAAPAVEHVTVVERLADVPFEIDIVNVFRRSTETDAVIDQVIERKNARGDVRAVWLQSGITSREGAAKCAAAGITYIEDMCIAVVQRYVAL
jgi:predicted CoA-binding protein